MNDECHVALREVRHASNAARRVPALLPAQSSIGRAFRMQSRWALIPLIVGRRVRGGWRRMLRRAQSPIRRHARVQVLELARFYHAMPLAIIEAERFNRLITFERPGEARGGILAAGKQHQSATFSVFTDHRETP